MALPMDEMLVFGPTALAAFLWLLFRGWRLFGHWQAP